MLLAIELCQHPDQLAAWWDWPAHREARWHLSAEEQGMAAAAVDRRHRALAAQDPRAGDRSQPRS